MPDSYLAIASIAKDEYMRQRMYAAATQQATLGNVPLIDEPVVWVNNNMYVWAASPGWAEKWTYAFSTHPDDDNYEPGKDAAVITDDDILATVQHLGTPNIPDPPDTPE